VALLFRRATQADLPAIIALLADDRLGQGREDAADPPNQAYLAAFAAIAADANQYLVVDVCLGHSRMPRARLRADTAYYRQAKARGTTLLRKPRFCREP